MFQVLISKDYLIKNFSITSLAMGLGVASGILLDAVILFYFGLSKETDAFFAALAIPFLISSTLEIQIPKVLVPMCTERLWKDERKSTFHLLSNFITVCSILLLSTSSLVVGLAWGVTPILVPGFHHDVVSLAVQLTMILAWAMVLRGIAAILQSILLSHHKYLVPSSAKCVSNIAIILFVVIFHGKLGIYALAFGTILGSAASFLVVLSATLALGFRYNLVCAFNDARLHYIFKLLLYPLSSHALGECKVLVENYLLSFFSGGSLSALRYATKIVDAFVSVIIGSIATTTLPLVSHFSSAKDLKMMKLSTLQSIKLSIFVAVPFSIWIIFNGESLIMLLFSRGAFSRADAALTAILIALLAPYIVLSRVSSIVQMMFYATFDTRTPAISALLTFLISVIVALMGVNSVGIYIFPIASSAAALCTAIVMSILLHQRFGPLGWKRLGLFGVQFAGVMAVTLFILMVSSKIQTYVSSETVVERLIIFIVPTVLGCVTFVTASHFFGVVHSDRWYGLLRRNRASL